MSGELKRLAVGMGVGYATRRITVDGERVGFMYREAPDAALDSGWRFLAGDESQAYMDDPDNVGAYDLNAIANLDPSVVLHLLSPQGSAFERDERTGRFVKVEFEPPEE